jgi:hypothetical protein
VNSNHEAEKDEDSNDSDDTLEAELRKIHDLECIPLDEEIDETS